MGSVCNTALSQSHKSREAQQPIGNRGRGTLKACTRPGARLNEKKNEEKKVYVFFRSRSLCKYTSTVEKPISLLDALRGAMTTAAKAFCYPPGYYLKFYL